MSLFEECIARERRHLLEGPAPDERPGGLGTVRLIVWCELGAEQVIERAREVLTLVNQHGAGEWPSDDDWRNSLPEWFVFRCAPDMSQAESDAELARWQSLSPEEQSEWAAEPWSLENWIYWFLPENRYWYWWDAKPLDGKVFVIAVEVHEHPFPSDALEWLLRASGAERITEEPDL